MNRLARRLGVGRALSAVALMAAAAVCALLLGVTTRGQPASGPPVGESPRATLAPTTAPDAAGPSPDGGSPYTVVQMNLCLSGVADCYGAAAYPAVVEEAAALIEELQ